MVILDYLKKLWNFISSLTSETKTIIIFILLIIILNPIPRSYYEETLSNVMKKQKEELRKNEDDGFRQAPYIAQCIDNIKIKDPDCSNVLLLSYHNTKHSLQGFSYIYLDCIRESVKSYSDEYVADYCSPSQPTNYQHESRKIAATPYLRVDSPPQLKNTCPR